MEKKEEQLAGKLREAENRLAEAASCSLAVCV